MIHVLSLYVVYHSPIGISLHFIVSTGAYVHQYHLLNLMHILHSTGSTPVLVGQIAQGLQTGTLSECVT